MEITYDQTLETLDGADRAVPRFPPDNMSYTIQIFPEIS